MFSTGTPHVALILTDGGSNNEAATILQAEECHDQGLTMFSVGIGSNLRISELEAIASYPTCIHLIMLEGFTEFESLSDTIQERTCDAPIIFDPPRGPNGTDIPIVIPPGFGENCKVMVGPRGLTIRMYASTGSATYYTSRVTYPNEVYYDEKIVTTPDMPAALFIPHGKSPEKDETIFCRILGDLRNHTDLLIGLRPGNRDHCEDHKCQEGECIDLGDNGMLLIWF